MKIRHILFVIFLVIVVLIGFGLQTFLTKGLTTALNQTVFPEIQAEYGLDMSIENASVNLLHRRAELEGFSVRNLDGFQEPSLLTVDHCKIYFELISLFKRKPIIKSVKSSGMKLTVERNEQGRINIQELTDNLKSAKTPGKKPLEARIEELPLEEQVPLAIAGSAGQSPMQIRRLATEGTVTYIDSRLGLNLPLALRLTGSDLFVPPAEGQPDSLLVLRGAHADNPDAFVIDLNAIVEPLVDTDNPSFNASGSISAIDAALLGDILTKNDMESGPFSIKPSITCQQSRLKGSQVELVLNDLKYRDVALGQTALNLPLSGTLRDPVVDLTAALQSLFEKSTINFLKALGMQELNKPATNQPATNQLATPPADGSNPSETKSLPAKTLGDVLVEELGKRAKEVDENKDLKNSLKLLGDSIFGN